MISEFFRSIEQLMTTGRKSAPASMLADEKGLPALTMGQVDCACRSSVARQQRVWIEGQKHLADRPSRGASAGLAKLRRHYTGMVIEQPVEAHHRSGSKDQPDSQIGEGIERKVCCDNPILLGPSRNITER
jgi:hypothetical protein